MLRGIITQRYRSFTVKSVFSDREPELWLRVTPVAYRSFLIPTGLKFQSALAKTTRALIWNRNRVTRILVNILTTRILSVSSPQYVIYVDFNGVGPFTSWCCQSLAIMHVLLDGHERERCYCFLRQRVRPGDGGGIRWCLTGQAEWGSVLWTQILSYSVFFKPLNSRYFTF